MIGQLNYAAQTTQTSYLHEDHDSQDGVAQAEDTPEHTHGLRVLHVFGGVVVTPLMIVYFTLHLHLVLSQ